MLTDKVHPRSEALTVLTVFLSVAMAAPNVLKVEVVPSEPTEGQTVTFVVTGIEESFRYSEWYRGTGTLATNQIIRFNNGEKSTNNGNMFFAEASIQANGSLVIDKVRKELEGPYTIFIQGFENSFQQTVSLKVAEAQQTPSLSKGAIAGISIAVIAVVVAGIGGAIYALRPKDSGN